MAQTTLNSNASFVAAWPSGFAGVTQTFVIHVIGKPTKSTKLQRTNYQSVKERSARYRYLILKMEKSMHLVVVFVWANKQMLKKILILDFEKG